MANNINAWNAKIDNTLTVMRLGRNGILYEYVLPYGANPNHFATEALDVKSRKGYSKYDNGKRAGQYQPIGDKSNFTFFQLKELSKKGLAEYYIKAVREILEKIYYGD